MPLGLSGRIVNEVRIISGRFRGRKIHFKTDGALRPTLGSVRETLFNWLRHEVVGARCLDAFAGTGILGFEALSRLAEQVTFVEQNRQTFDCLQKNVTLLQAEERVHLCHDSALAYLRREEAVFDLIFLDPPFSQGLLPQALRCIEEKKTLTTQGFLYFEAERVLDLLPMIAKYWRLHRHKTLGEVQFGLLSWKKETF